MLLLLLLLILLLLLLLLQHYDCYCFLAGDTRQNRRAPLMELLRGCDVSSRHDDSAVVLFKVASEFVYLIPSV